MSVQARGRSAPSAAVVLALGAVAAVLAAAPYKAFDLDRYFVPKELALYLTATIGAVTCLGAARRIRYDAADVALAGYLALSTISALLATNRWLGARSLGISLAGIIVYWIAKALARNGAARPILIGVALAATVAAATSLLQAYGVRSEYMSLNRAPGGTLGNRNFVAHIAAIGAPVLVLCAIEARGALGMLLATLGTVLASAALFLSRSRGAWLAVLVSAAICIVLGFLGRARWRDIRRARRLVILVMAAAGGVIAAWALPNTLDWNSRSPYLDSVRGLVNTKEGSGRGRVVQYKNTLLLAKSHPVLGIGPGNWPVAYPRVAPRSDPSLDHDTGMTSNPWPSSDWVAVIAERGIPATLLLALAFVAIALGAVRALWRAQDGAQFLAALALLATLAATTIVGAFDAVLLLALPALIAWAALGALGPIASQSSGGHESPLPDGRRRWLQVAALVIGVLFALRSTSQLFAMSAYSASDRIDSVERAAQLDPGSYRIRLKLAELAALRGKCDEARTQATAAQRLFPNAPAPRRLIAQCGARRAR